MGARYTGIDFSPKMIDAARKNAARFTEKDNVRLQAGDITDLEFPSQSFDAVVAMGVLEYLNVEQIRQALTQIRSVLKPGGIAILTVPKKHCWGKAINEIVSPIGRIIRWRPYAKATRLQEREELQRLYLNAKQLDGLCLDAGLAKADSRHYNAEFLSKPFSLMAPRLSYLLNRPFEHIAQIPGGRFLATGYIGMYRSPGE
jgi:ubiquinone/menaquinone biosynthesis C-methylase UbiE